MAFTSEAVARLRLDTSDFGRALTKTTADFGRAGDDIGKKLKRSFGAGDVVKGLMQGIGIGSVSAIGDLIAKPFEIAYERAKDAVGLTSSLRDITTKEIVATSGHKTALREMHREAKDLGTDIEAQGKLVSELNANPLNYISPTGFAIMRSAEQELNALKVRQAEVQSQINISEKERIKAVAQITRETSLSMDINEADLRDASDREKLQIRLNALRKEYNRIIKDGNKGTILDANNLKEQVAITNQQAILDKKAKQDLVTSAVSIGVAASKGNPRRGRTETERIAQRGMKAKAAADESILKGDAVGALNNAERARGDLETAGRRVAGASRLIPKNTADALGGELIKANEMLKNINANLTPKSTGTVRK